MKIAVIYGTQRHGSTYEIVQQVLRKLTDPQKEITEFFLPRDFGSFCVGCGRCFVVKEDCPHEKALRPIKKAMLEADLLIFASPVYVFHVTGQMKAFLDHFGNSWMVHRPERQMFRKTALLITTAAGAGMKSTLQDLKDNMDFWGVGNVISYGKQVRALEWQNVNDNIRRKIAIDTDNIAKKCEKSVRKKKLRIRVRMMFYKMRIFQKIGINPVDVQYWKEQGWMDQKRPWKV